MYNVGVVSEVLSRETIAQESVSDSSEELSTLEREGRVKCVVLLSCV